MGWSGGVFTRTNGVYTGSEVWQDDAAAGVDIESDRHDTHDQDLAEGIDACLNRDGSNAMTGNLDMGGQDIVNVGTTFLNNPTIQGDTIVDEGSLRVNHEDYTTTNPDDSERAYFYLGNSGDTTAEWSVYWDNPASAVFPQGGPLVLRDELNSRVNQVWDQSGNAQIPGRLRVGDAFYATPTNPFEVSGDSYFDRSVGIGTSTPAATIEARNGETSTDVAYFRAGNSGFTGNVLEVFGFANNANYNSIYVTDSAGNDKFVVRGDGNVGIGIAAPSSALDVQGGALTVQEHIQESEQATIANGATHEFSGIGSAIAGSIGRNIFIVQGNGSNAYSVFATQNGNNYSIGTGANSALGNAANPGTGTVFNIWQDGTSKNVKVENVSGSSKVVTVTRIGAA